ncbi:MAG: hypothetical protein ABIQ99_18510, partial [Thermoflexales bacterium]
MAKSLRLASAPLSVPRHPKLLKFKTPAIHAKNPLISGAGIGRLTTKALLAKAGHDVTVLEA